MVVSSSKRLKKLGSIELFIDENPLAQEQQYKYLGVVEHFHQKLCKRLGVLKRIKHMLPPKTRVLVVKTLILHVTMLEYANLVWGDRNNASRALMNNLQVLHNKSAKLVLNLP
jgi:hypothetical protein